MHWWIVVLVLVLSAAAGPAAIRPADSQGNPLGTTTVSAGVTGIHQVAGGLDAGGDVQWSGLTFHGSVSRQFVPAFAAGLSLRYDVEDWRIRSAAAFGEPAPWQHLQRPGASLNLSLALSRTFLLRVSPTVEWAYDSQAGASDAFVYGAVVSAAQVFSPRLVLGAGASMTRQFYSVKTTPFVIVNWQLSNRWRVANAAATGPLGGAGVELRYAPNANWELAAGGVWRSDRWRIADPGPHAATVAETSAIPMLVRVSRKLGPAHRLDLQAGAMTAGRLTLRDDDGHDRMHDGYGPTPAVSAAWSARF